MTTTSQSFLPDPTSVRLSPDDFRERASSMLQAECPRLMGNDRSALGEAGFALVLNGDGTVREATLSHPSRDERMNTIFGGLAAQLVFAGHRGGDGARAVITAGYSCAPTAAVATLELNATP